MPLYDMDEYAETLMAQRISMLPGVSQVQVYGAQKFAVRVQVDPVAAAARGISLEDVHSVVSKTNSNTPVGIIAGLRQNTTITATAAIEPPAMIRIRRIRACFARRSICRSSLRLAVARRCSLVGTADVPPWLSAESAKSVPVDAG